MLLGQLRMGARQTNYAPLGDVDVVGDEGGENLDWVLPVQQGLW